MLSFVIPVYNEAESLAELHRELDEVAAARQYSIEIIFVDDGSNDASWSEIERLAAADGRVSGIRLRRNFGKAAALMAGFRAARGEIVFTLDADLQDDPHEIPKFLAEMAAGADVVSGWKQVRHDPWHKVYPSWVFNWMVSSLTGVSLHDHNCGFKSYRREIFDEVNLYGELHRFVPVLAAARGFKIGEVVVEHRERKHGESKYGVLRVVKGFLDLLTVYFLTSYDRRPQHLLGSLGLLCFGLGGLGVGILTIWWIVSRLVPGLAPLHLHETAVFYYAGATLLLGAQFLSIGFVAELITAQYAKDNPPYSIAQRTASQTGPRPAPPAPKSTEPESLPFDS